MNFKNIVGLFAILSVFILQSCNLTKDVEIKLPLYESQPVVECYLEPGESMALLMTKSSPYFEQLGKPEDWLLGLFLDSATVVISTGGVSETLKNELTFNLETGKIFNYSSPTKVSTVPGTIYSLDITLKNGRKIAATTTLQSIVPIDSVVIEWKANDTLARALTYMTDDLATADFYRRSLHKSSLDSLASDDFPLDDQFFNTSKVVFGTLYEFEEGDTIFNTITHLDEPYYNYLNSIQLAIQSNFNPFGQPSRILSNVSGTANPIGIFTGLSYSRIRTIVMR
jgi:Domain of unknown function (DUF4249)